MSGLDWVVLLGTQVFIVAYGMVKSRHNSKQLESYVLGDRQISWFTVGLSVMATQASAITFISTTGQAYSDGLRFVQFYFGLPIAMVLISWAAVPVYHRMKVFTAYQYLENRFDVRVRVLAAFLFLLQRGISASFTLYAPALVLSVMLDWDIALCNIAIGAVVIYYTLTGGARAISYTQKQQMIVILLGLAVSGVLLAYSLPVPLDRALEIAGAAGRMRAITFDVDFSDRYNLWSGLLAGTFLALGYFGTDQSQVARYLSGKSLKEIRLGLLMNGVLKIPMQLGILFVGVLLFVFYQFHPKPLYFHSPGLNPQNFALDTLQKAHSENHDKKREFLLASSADEPGFRKRFREMLAREDSLEQAALAQIHHLDQPDHIRKVHQKAADYAFLHYVFEFMPVGLVGLLVSVILAAAMSSASSEISALAIVSTLDVYQRIIARHKTDTYYISAAKWLTLFWGVWVVGCTFFLGRFENLIQSVNIVGSLVYGTMLGVFLSAFFLPRVKSGDVFVGLIVGELLVLILWGVTPLAYLWYNLLGCITVMGVSLLLSYTRYE